MKYTARMKCAGEQAVRLMSEKAQKFYNETEIDIYESGNRYAYTLAGETRCGLTFDELTEELEQLADMFA